MYYTIYIVLLEIHDKLYDESLQTFLRKTFLLGVSNLHREILLI
jgi:hypothetical protein